MSPNGLAASQRPFVWIRLRISPSASAGPQAFRFPSIGMCPYGISPWTIRSAPITPARPTSITFDASAFRPMRKPIRKTVAPRSTHAGHTVRPREARPRAPTQTQRKRT